jgi:hypothetical protein
MEAHVSRRSVGLQSRARMAGTLHRSLVDQRWHHRHDTLTMDWVALLILAAFKSEEKELGKNETDFLAVCAGDRVSPTEKTKRIQGRRTDGWSSSHGSDDRRAQGDLHAPRSPTVPQGLHGRVVMPVQSRLRTTVEYTYIVNRLSGMTGHVALLEL